MRVSLPTHQLAEVARFLPLYDDFPYLVTRVVPTLYHIIPLPGTLDELSLRSLARYQHNCNQLPTCLALGERRCVYFDAHGAETVSDQGPRGGIVVSEKLRPCTPLENTLWWEQKSHRLKTYADQQELVRKGRFLLGDLTKGGRQATSEEVKRLAGTNREGIPKGLSQCAGCLDWKGVCLDPNPMRQGQIMVVSCRCENDNRCARCYQPLAERKLNANFYRESDGEIWHTPGFVGLSHRCQGQHILSVGDERDGVGRDL